MIARRSYLAAIAVSCLTALAGCSQGGAEAIDPDRPDFDGFLSNANGYDGVVDATGESVTTVTVGGGDGMSFDPAAVRIDAGSTVRWEWSGNGGTHNVQAEDGSFESEYSSEAGTTFEQTLDTLEIVKYVCVPHEASGMKGVVVVE